jgi:hypothetical protein
MSLRLCLRLLPPANSGVCGATESEPWSIIRRRLLLASNGRQNRLRLDLDHSRLDITHLLAANIGVDEMG